MKTINQNKNVTQNEEMIMKKIMTGLLVAVLGTLSLTPLAEASGSGSSGGQFLRLGAGSRAAGMAGGFSAIADDVTAIYYNPAGLATLEKKEVSLSYNLLYEDTASQFAGYAHPTEKGTFSASLNMFSVSDIEKRSLTGGDADSPDGGTFDTRDMALSLAWANKLSLGSNNFNYGVALKYVSSDLNTETANTGAVDLGVLYRLLEGGKLGLSLAVLNLGGELKFADEGDPLPLTIKPGVSYRLGFERLGTLTAAIDSDILINDDKGYVQTGLEWAPFSIIALRGGYQFGRDEDAGSGFATGMGLRFSNVGIDYAFVPYGELGNTHRMSFGLKF